MSYIDDIFTRLDIQHIREFLLHGVEECNVSDKSYYERLKSAERISTSFLRSFYTDNSDYEESTMPVFSYISVVEEVYMEIGMQCGVKLAMQLLESDR
ncbi:MAG: hypothetical protein PHR14_07960 [Oscillospiraceae bacterium]|nr:hypothetical protein [Oscillospiraceae bacterium]